MFSWLVILANNVESLSGGAGWIGAGLLGAVLGWLLIIHLPAKDKLMKELIGDKDAQVNVLLEHKWAAIQTMSTDHKEAITRLATEFRAVIAETSAHCDKEVGRLVSYMEERERQASILSKVVEGQKDYQSLLVRLDKAGQVQRDEMRNQLVEIHDAVNGGMGKILENLALAREEIARLSGTAEDQAAARKAREASEVYKKSSHGG